MCNFWNFGQWPSFMPKYGNFRNRSVSRKLLHNQSENHLHYNRRGRKRVYMYVELWSMAKFHTHANIAILKNQPASRNCCSYSENKLKFAPGIERECMYNLWNLAQRACKLVLKQSIKAHGPLVISSNIVDLLSAVSFQIDCLDLHSGSPM